jgi:hypothetical protein
MKLIDVVARTQGLTRDAPYAIIGGGSWRARSFWRVWKVGFEAMVAGLSYQRLLPAAITAMCLLFARDSRGC